MNDEFKEFTETAGEKPPSRVFNAVSKIVTADLNPPFSKVFLKLSGVHLLVGTLTLFICPQFGIAFFDGMGLMHVFMQYGEQACMVACGAVFLSASLLVSAFVLLPEEVSVLRGSRWAHLPLLSSISFAVLLCFGAEVVFSLGAFWILGTVIGGLVALEAGWSIRRRFA